MLAEGQAAHTPVVLWPALDTSPPLSWDLPEAGWAALCPQTLVVIWLLAFCSLETRPGS